MAIVYPAETGGAGEPWYDRIEQHPVAAFAGILILGLLVGYVISKLRGTSTSSSSTTSSSSAQPDVLYYPTQNTFEDTTTTNYNAPPTTGPTPTPTPSQNTATVRGPGAVPGWDNTHPGVPLRPGTSASGQVTIIPWGTSITLGPAVQGAANAGDTTWYPVSYGNQSGYLSAFDVVISNAAAAIGSGAASLFDRLRMAVPLWN